MLWSAFLTSRARLRALHLALLRALDSKKRCQPILQMMRFVSLYQGTGTRVVCWRYLVILIASSTMLQGFGDRGQCFNSRLFPCARMQTVINLASPSKSSSGRSQLSNVKSRNLSAELQSVSRERVKSRDLSVSSLLRWSLIFSRLQRPFVARCLASRATPRYLRCRCSRVLTLRQKLDALTNSPMLAQESNLDMLTGKLLIRYPSSRSNRIFLIKFSNYIGNGCLM